MENQDAIDTCLAGSVPNPSKTRVGIKVLDFKPFNPID